jgi:CRISPR/Cas system-associated exonuclease Cas4 (RecB family)
MSIKDVMIQKLHDIENARPRSTQTEVGPSEIGGCGRKVWYRVNNTPETNPNTLKLASMMGTAIHSMIEKAFLGDKRFLIETEVEFKGIKGHIDLIDTETKTIWDWKTTSKKNLSYFGSSQYETQIQLYAYLCNNNGIEIDYVGLVGIARDGNENDIVELLMPYNEEIALKAIDRYESIKAQETPPRPEKSVSFCKDYCQYYGECPSLDNPKELELILNTEVAGLAEEYYDINSNLSSLKLRLDELKEKLLGTNGITESGISVRWSEVSGRSSIDESEVTRLLGFVPKKTGNPSSRFTVKKENR